MQMSISLDYLEEPTLQFGQYFEHQDTKMGLAEFGPFGKNKPGLHRSEIKLGFIGTREMISLAQDWIKACGQPIESPKIKRTKADVGADLGPMFSGSVEELQVLTRAEKILRPDFVGFNKESPFECEFQVNERWVKPITTREIDGMLALPDRQERILKLVDLFTSYIEGLAAHSPAPDIIVVALTQEISDKAYTVQVNRNFYLNFRRALKARAMRWGIPIQIVTQRMLEGKDPELQDKATRAWNFSTAQYYKAQGVPWRPTTIDSKTCFVGISFYVAREEDERLTLRSSVAQAFDYLGQGLVLRGDPFEWSERQNGPSPHLTKEGARKLISQTLQEYINLQGSPPNRVVIHKTSEFWGPGHDGYNELEGFYEGIDSVYPNREIDLVSLRQTGVVLFREGNYPPLRGIYFTLEGKHHFLYTMGYIPYLQTYPALYVPEPWQITDHHGGTRPKELLEEVLALTKMNVNNCAFADGTPITLLFSERIGEIMKHIPEGETVHPHYRFYM
jgi:hypothetical protein